MKTEKLFRWVPIEKGMSFMPNAATIVKFDNGTCCDYGNEYWPMAVATHYSEPVEAVVMEPEELIMIKRTITNIIQELHQLQKIESFKNGTPIGMLELLLEDLHKPS